MSELEIDNYALHKQLFAQVDSPSEERLNEQLASVGAWFSSNLECNDYTVMCREKYDFTVLHFDSMNYEKGVQTLRELLESRGTIMDIAFYHGNAAYECWIRTPEDEVVLYMLFESPWIIVNI